MGVRLTWTTPLSAVLSTEISSFRERLRAVQPELAEDGIVLPVLPGPHDSRLAILMVRPGGDDCRWSLFLADTPEDDDDEAGEEGDDEGNRISLNSAAEVAGGREQVAAFATRHWPKPPTVVHSIHFHLSSGQWRCRTLPTTVQAESEDGPVLSIGTDATVDEISYRFTNGANGVSRVSISCREDPTEYLVDISARGLLRIGDTRWIPFADEVRDLIVNSLFEGNSHG